MSGPYKTPTGLGDKDRDGSPPTGREAAAAAAQTAGSIREDVYREIENAGWRGLTPYEIAKRLGLDEFTVRPRCSDLKTDERIACNGERRPGRNGKAMGVLVAVRFLPADDDADDETPPVQGALL